MWDFPQRLGRCCATTNGLERVVHTGSAGGSLVTTGEERVKVVVGFGADVLPQHLQQLLARGLAGHDVHHVQAAWSNLIAAAPDPALATAEVIFGQPAPEALLGGCASLVQLTSAGWDRYDRPDLRAAFKQRGAALCNASSVYAQPCAEHVLALMLAHCRRLPRCLKEGPDWPSASIRAHSQLLAGHVLVLGHGAIAQRLLALLVPFGVAVTLMRRSPQGPNQIDEQALAGVLPTVDHLVNTLPGTAATQGLLDRRRLELLPCHAVVYNVGRGGTIDQDALADRLAAGELAGAYLDVTVPEPLPPEHRLWSEPRCIITPHVAGGRAEEHEALVRHFLANLGRLVRGEDLVDRRI
jgi:phosphoglycerate dehydrogenase-like enzyme